MNKPFHLGSFYAVLFICLWIVFLLGYRQSLDETDYGDTLLELVFTPGENA